MISTKIMAVLFSVGIIFLTLVGMVFVLITGGGNPSPLVQSAQIAGAGFSIVLSTLLALLYAQQKNLLEKQTKLQAASMEADMYFNEQEFTKQNRLHITVSNRGGGKSNNFVLVAEIIPSIGPTSTFEFGLVRFRGEYKNEPIVTPNETDADLYLTTETDPSVSTESYNRVYWYLSKNLHSTKNIYIKLNILYDDFVSDGCHVSGFSRSERIDIDGSYSKNPKESIEEAISEKFEDNLGKLLANDKIVSQIEISVDQML